MGLTHQSTGLEIKREDFVPAHIVGDYTIGLAGNPNTGKSTIFNALTGLNQHTGNWPGKTVAQARGFYQYAGKNFVLMDLPGTYSLLASSPEEEIARDFLCFGRPDATIIMVDATCLERNLNLVLQVLEITPKVVVCLNLIDEAERKGLVVDVDRLRDELGVPVVPTAANSGRGLASLKDWIYRVASNQVSCQPNLVKYPESMEQAIRELEGELKILPISGLSERWVAIRLLENDASALAAIDQYAIASS
ncbi:MAG: iron transporter FeoB [Firmicutes bacterium]|nr:iron transporter FeoB [Bacillota bacterium]